MSRKNLVLKLNATMLSSNQIAGVLKIKNPKNYWKYKADFLHAGTYLLELQIDDVSSGGHNKACPCIPKEAIKTLRSQKLKNDKVDFMHAASYLLKL